ncbi:uncharacterized protein LOC120336733 [Styela clava]
MKSVQGDMSFDHARLIKALNNPEMAYDLGVISQLIYKNSRAHRCQKYFQALKKIDRHMHEFHSLKLSQYFKTMRSKQGEEMGKDTQFILRFAIQLLKEVENNCLETVKSCLPQINLERFISLHTLHINVVSNIWKHVKELITELETWLKTRDPIESSQTRNGISMEESIQHKRKIGSESPFGAPLTVTTVEPLVDLGEVISRDDSLINQNLTPAKDTNTNLNFPMSENEDVVMRTPIDLNKSSRRYSNSPLRWRPYHFNFLKHCFHHAKRKSCGLDF